MVINLANWFAAKGHQVDLVLFNDHGIYKHLIASDVRLHNFHTPRSFFALPALRRYLKEHQPDILFSALYYVNIIAILGVLSAQVATRLVISERNHLSRSIASFSQLKKTFWTKVIKSLYSKSHKVIGISDGVCADLKTVLPLCSHQKLETIYNPVITDDFAQQIKMPAPDIFPDNASIKIIASGRLVPQKDYPTMLKAFSIYLQTQPNAYLVIMGTGKDEDLVKKMAMDLGIDARINFVGFVDNPLAYMAQSDVFLMTSAWEGFGNVIVEALYCGLNIVLTDCPSGPSEILKDGQFGALCQVGDASQLAYALSVSQKLQYNSDHQRARALDFHVNTIGRQFEYCFEQVMGVSDG